MPHLVKVKTGSPAEARGSYSRIVAVDNLIFVSLTGGRNPETKIMPTDPAEQTHQVLANIEGALRSIGACLEDVVAARVYIPYAEDIDPVMAVYADRMRHINPTLTLTSSPLAMAEFKVEIEVTAYRGVSKTQPEEILLSL